MINYWTIPGIYNSNSVEGIIYNVTKLFNINREQLFIKSRKREIVICRQVCMWLMRRNLDNNLYSFQRIGDYFGKDHATVMYAIKTIENLLETDKELKKQIKNLI